MNILVRWVRKIPDPRIGLTQGHRRRAEAWAEIQRLQHLWEQRDQAAAGECDG